VLRDLTRSTLLLRNVVFRSRTIQFVSGFVRFCRLFIDRFRFPIRLVAKTTRSFLIHIFFRPVRNPRLPRLRTIGVVMPVLLLRCTNKWNHVGEDEYNRFHQFSRRVRLPLMTIRRHYYAFTKQFEKWKLRVNCRTTTTNIKKRRIVRAVLLLYRKNII